jgi:hypothetical protein
MEGQLRSAFGAGSVLVDGAGVLELSLFAAGAGVLVSDEGAGVCVDGVVLCAGWFCWVLMSFVCDCVCGVVVSVELCAYARPMVPAIVDAAIAVVRN